MYLHLWQSWILFCTNFYSPHPGGKQAQKMPCGEPGKQESGPFCIFLAIFPGKWVMRFVCRVPPPPPRGAGRFGWCSWQRWIQIHSLFFILFWARIKPGHPRASCVASSLPRLPSSSITQSYRRIKKIKKKNKFIPPIVFSFFCKFSFVPGRGVNDRALCQSVKAAWIAGSFLFIRKLKLYFILFFLV